MGYLSVSAIFFLLFPSPFMAIPLVKCSLHYSEQNGAGFAQLIKGTDTHSASTHQIWVLKGSAVFDNCQACSVSCKAFSTHICPNVNRATKTLLSCVETLSLLSSLILFVFLFLQESLCLWSNTLTRCLTHVLSTRTRKTCSFLWVTPKTILV